MSSHSPPPSSFTPSLAPGNCQSALICFVSLWTCPFRMLRIIGTPRDMAFWVGSFRSEPVSERLSFSWLNNSPSCAWTTSYSSSSVDGRLGCFRLRLP